MCRQELPPMVKTKLRFITFGRNRPYGGNNLRGCVNNSYDFTKRFLALDPCFDVRMYLNRRASARNYLKAGGEAISLLDPGATVLILMDSCFSGSATRLLTNPAHPTKNRFFDPGLPVPEKVRSRVFSSKADIHWMVMSACMEQESAADAYIDGRYVGAFSYHAVKSLKKGMTYLEWYQTVRSSLPGKIFSQTPTFEGPFELVNRRVGEGQTLIIHNSSHGSWAIDQDGDEEDGRDEGIYLDRLLIDDEINIMLQKIPSVLKTNKF